MTPTCNFAILRIDWDRVPKTRVALYREEGGSCPFVEWFDELTAKVQDKCYLRLERLREKGHELRRPEADILRDGIYELRVSLGSVLHRILYFFHGAMAAVVSPRLATFARCSTDWVAIVPLPLMRSVASAGRVSSIALSTSLRLV